MKTLTALAAVLAATNVAVWQAGVWTGDERWAQTASNMAPATVCLAFFAVIGWVFFSVGMFSREDDGL